MVSLWQTGIGVAAIFLGVAWMLAPTRMNRIQTRVLSFGFADDDYDQTETQRTAGRVGGAVLAILGAVLALGIQP